jgi:hypothetical protein
MYYMLSSGCFAAACLQVITKGVLDPRLTWADTCVVCTSALCSYYVICLYMYVSLYVVICSMSVICYMSVICLVLGPSSGSIGSV